VRVKGRVRRRRVRLPLADAVRAGRHWQAFVVRLAEVHMQQQKLCKRSQINQTVVGPSRYTASSRSICSIERVQLSFVRDCPYWPKSWYN